MPARQAVGSGATVSVVFFPKAHSPVYPKTDKCKLGDILQSTWLAPFRKRFSVQSKEGLENSPRLEETEMRQLSAVWGRDRKGRWREHWEGSVCGSVQCPATLVLSFRKRAAITEGVTFGETEWRNSALS